MERAALFAIVLASLSIKANAKLNTIQLNKLNFAFHPILGLDVAAVDQSFGSNYGRNHFNNHYPSTNVYLGTLIHRYVGVEVGYEHLYRQQYMQYYPEVNGATAPVLGFFNAFNIFPATYISEAFTQGWHCNLLGLLPVSNKTQLIGSVGLGWLRMYFDTVAITSGIPATPVVRWSSKKRTLAQIGIGVRQMITNQFGVRLEATWAGTSRLGATIPVPGDPGGIGFNEPEPTGNYTVKPKDSYGLAIGFFFQL